MDEGTSFESFCNIWILKKLGMSVWIGLNWLKIDPLMGFCEHGNELAGSINTEYLSLIRVVTSCSRMPLLCGVR
jgi:hypothetical protein